MTGEVEVESHWRQCHVNLDCNREWCISKIHPSVGEWCWMSLLWRYVWTANFHYIPIWTTHLSAYCKTQVHEGEPVWQLEQSRQIQLETGQTGRFWRQNTLVLNLTSAINVLQTDKKSFLIFTKYESDFLMIKQYDLMTSSRHNIHWMNFVVALSIQQNQNKS